MAEALKRAIPLEQVLIPDLLNRIAHMRNWPADRAANEAQALIEQIETIFAKIQ
jgi:hypothetical protein